MSGALVAGLGVGVGALLVVGGLAPPRPSLVVSVRRLVPGATPVRGGGVARLALRLSRHEPDLRVVGRTRERHALDKLVAALCFAGLPTGAAVLAAAGGAALSPTLVAVATLALAPVGFVVPDLALRSEAAARRRDFRHALGAYLDLVAIVVAGGSGPEGALHDAVRSGRGWAFAELEQALESARLAGAPPWSALARLGDELGVNELVELAASVSLAGEHGAKVRASLAAKAASIREHELSETEAEAQAATEKMAIPVVLMLFGFLVFVGYPAMDNVLTGL